MNERLLGVLGGILVVVGSVLPWATVQTAFGQLWVAGTDGDGQFTLAIGVALVLAAFPGGTRASWRAWAVLVLGALASAIALLDLLSLGDSLARTDTVRSSIGIGLWLSLAGGVIATVAGFLLVNAKNPGPEGPGS